MASFLPCLPCLLHCPIPSIIIINTLYPPLLGVPDALLLVHSTNESTEQNGRGDYNVSTESFKWIRKLYKPLLFCISLWPHTSAPKEAIMQEAFSYFTSSKRPVSESVSLSCIICHCLRVGGGYVHTPNSADVALRLLSILIRQSPNVTVKATFGI